MFWRQIKALLYKELIVQKRNYISTICLEFGLVILWVYVMLRLIPDSLEVSIEALKTATTETNGTALNKDVQAIQRSGAFPSYLFEFMFSTLFTTIPFNTTFYYHPNSTFTRALFKEFKQLAPILNPTPIGNKSELIELIGDLSKTYDPFNRTLTVPGFGGVIFHGDVNKTWPDAGLDFEILPVAFGHNNVLYNKAGMPSLIAQIKNQLPPYVRSGFSILQVFLSESYVKLAAKQSGYHRQMTDFISIQPYPKIVEPRVTLYLNAALVWSAVWMITFMPLLLFTKRVVDEKASKMKELLKLMGMKELNYWLAISIVYMTILLIDTFFLAIFLHDALKQVIGFWLLFFMFSVYALMGYCFMMALTVFSRKAVFSIFWMIILLSIFGRPFWRYFHKPGPDARDIFKGEADTPEWLHLVFCLFATPNYALILLCYLLIEGIDHYNAAEYLPSSVDFVPSWSTLFNVPPEYEIISPGLIIVFMLLSSVISIIFTWYVGAIWPWQEGIPKPFYFPIRWLIRWLKKADSKRNRKVEHEENGRTASGGGQSTGNPAHFEVLEGDVKHGIQITNLTKKFGPQKVAVKNLNLKVPFGRITVLLGHNGAGKSTTMNMITGMFPPTFGEVSVNDINMNLETSRARRQLGLCPQDNILFQDLTVEEHLRFFGLLKDSEGEALNNQINETLSKVGLSVKRNETAKALSGGMRRRLQLSIAFMGNTKILVLDEPSSGLDVEARRQIWDVLLAMRKDYLILISTHHMEEADCLGDIIAIMSEGSLRCYGTSLFLKRVFGIGYHLRIAKTDAFDGKKTKEVVRKILPSASIENDTPNELMIAVLKEETEQLPEFFEQIEDQKASLGIQSCGVNVTSLDDVFIEVGKMDNRIHAEMLRRTNSLEIVDTSLKTSGRGWRIFVALLKKRFLNAVRGYKAYLALMFLCCFWTYFALYLFDMITRTSVRYVEEWQAEINASSLGYKNVSGWVQAEQREWIPDFDRVALANGISPYQISPGTNITSYLIGVGESRYEEYLKNELLGVAMNTNGDGGVAGLLGFGDIGSAFGDFFDALSKPLKVTAWYNWNAFHSLPLAINTGYNTILERMARPGTIIRGIKVAIHHLRQDVRLTLVTKLTKLPYDIQGMALFLFFALAFAAPFPAFFAFSERISKAKLLQYMAGVRGKMYWATNFLFDVLLLALVFTPFWIATFTWPYNPFFYDLKTGAALAIAFIGFISSSVALAYLVSFMFRKPASSYAFILVPSALTVTIFNYIILIIKQFSNDDTATTWYLELLEYVLIIICKMCPLWLFTNILVSTSRATNSIPLCATFPEESLTEICKRDIPFLRTCCPNSCQDECFNESYNPFSFDSPGVAVDMVLLYVITIAAFNTIYLIESNVFRRRKLLGVPFEDSEDEDVRIERQTVEEIVSSGNLTSRAMVVRNLSKQFGSFMAVNRLSFGVKQQEFFGLLGVNGAGKTTTFRMLVGDERMSEGDAHLGIRSLVKDFAGFRQQLGYCPQNDALIDGLTGREHLELFANLRGVRSNSVNQTVKRILKLVNLDEYADINCTHYSGGNKRKLSLGIALVGSPKLILLDEPTAGVDPVARRILWKALEQFQKVNGSSIILSSHSMDECEALCNRIAITVRGQLKCLGSPQYLRSKFAQGRTVTVKCDPKLANSDDVERFMSKEFPSCSLKDAHGTTSVYVIRDKSISIASIFRSMSGAKRSLELEDFQVTDTNLEQIFLSFAHDGAEIQNGVTHIF